MLSRLFVVALLTAGLLHHTATAADVAFDDSFARKVCGEPPATNTLVELCLEMSAVGKRYSSELAALGVANPSAEVKVEHGHPQYQQVRELGIEVDVRAQELMVLMARALTAETSSDHFVLANGQLPVLEKKLIEMRRNEQSHRFIDALMEGGPPSARSLDETQGSSGGGDESGLSAYEPDQIVREAHVAQMSISDLIQQKRLADLPKKIKKTRKKKSKAKRKSSETSVGDL